MIHQPSKYHSNPLTHFLNLHSPTGGSGINSPHSISNREDEEEIDVDSLHKSPEENTDLDAVSGSMGKSFTIAAILGLKAAAAVASINDNNNNSQSGFKAVGSANYPNGFSHHQQLQNQRHFTDVMNLSMNQSLLSLKPPNCNSFDSLSRMNGPYSGQSHFLPSNFQHSPNGHSTALQNLQKLHQQHVSNANSISVSNGFRILNRPPDSGGKSSSKSQSMKSKRVRTIFTPEQLERLEAEFERQQYMVGPERLYLAHTLQLTEAQVKVWFQNRRIKFRKHHLELTQQRLAMLRQRQIPSNGSQLQGSAQSNSMSHHRSNSNGLDLEEMALSPDSRDSSSSHEDHTSSTG